MQKELDNPNSEFRYKRLYGTLPPKHTLKKENGNYLCRWCNNVVKPPRITMCSNSCNHEILLRINTSYMRQCIFNRDKGICSICNIDTKDIANIARQLYGDEKTKFLKNHNISNKRKITYRYGGSLWDADHIIPVKEGGGCCGLDNMRTLCIKCHKLITKTMMEKYRNKKS